MAKPKYQINERDYEVAKKYLNNRLKTKDGEWIRQLRLDNTASSVDFMIADYSNCNCHNTLNSWAEHYLSRSQWNNLKMSIRNQRRQKRWVIEINTDAYDLLRREKEYTGKTYSEIIIEVLEEIDEKRGLEHDRLFK